MYIYFISFTFQKNKAMEWAVDCNNLELVNDLLNLGADVS